ncbi:MAG: response regulator transcription factor [Beijerinckiaceae bacterium]|nr:response regulator transcription factor [Beijerinckiaceae bacterium]
MKRTEAIRVLIADDHPLIRGALNIAISGISTAAETLEAGTLEDAVALLEKDPSFNLLLLDLNMPGMKGFSGLTYVRAQYPGIPVMIVSGTTDRTTMRRCIDFGASGFLPKTLALEATRNAIQIVLDGGTWTPPDVDLSAPPDQEIANLVARLNSLTPQQMRVLMMLSEGMLNKQIAFELNVSEATVKAHVSAILTKLGVESRTQAVIAAAKIEAGQF